MHNRHLAKMIYIMRWARSHNPHLIVVIENPVGSLRDMPIMKDFMEEFDLASPVKVNYCTLGRLDHKPTYLWTNEIGLRGMLAKFTCSKETCEYYRKKHPDSVQGHLREFNVAAIPKSLAETVAHYVDSRFFLDGHHNKKPVILTKEQIYEFNKHMTDVADE